MSGRIAAARAISIVAHPFVLMLLVVTVSAVKLQGGRGGAGTLLLAVAVVVVPLWAFMLWKWRSGKWSTVDASIAKERPPVYWLALLLVAVLTLLLGLTSGWTPLLRGCAAVAAMLAISLALNRWIKLSNHMAFAAFAAVVSLRLELSLGIALLIVVPFLAWSRLTLSRHTWSEVVAGVLLGAVTGAITAAA
jgi:membrane-associated phospholipid phosphatase